MRKWAKEAAYPSLVWAFQLLLTCMIFYLFTHIFVARHTGAWINAFGNWDGKWFRMVAEQGYINVRTTAFFPMYPLLMRAVSQIFHVSTVVSGIVVSNLSLLLASIYLFKYVKMRFGDKIAKRATWLVLVFPVSVFFHVVYSESLNLLGIVLFFYFLEKNQWLWSMVAGGVATVTHDLGVILAPVALMCLGKRWKDLNKRRWWWRLLMIGIIPLALIIYMWFLRNTFHNPFEFLNAEAHWHRHWSLPVVNVFQQFAVLSPTKYTQNYIFLMELNGMVTLVYFAIGVGLLFDRTMSLEEKLFFWLMFLASTISEANHTITSFARFMMVIFPGVIALSKWIKNDTFFSMVFLTSFCISVITTGMFAAGYLIT